MVPAGLGRLVAELKTTSSREDVAHALAKLRLRRSDGDAFIELAEAGERERDGEGLHVTDRAFATVHLGRGVYASVPTAAARVRLLETARRAARDGVEICVVVTDESSHVGRVAIDTPRRWMRRARLPVAEPGDRFGPAGYAHCFFDEEPLLGEIARAGLAMTARQGFTFVLREAAQPTAPEHATPFAVELARVVRLVGAVDAERRRTSPQTVVAAMRARGRSAPARGAVGRARLRRAIGWADAVARGGASCYRRVLLEIALDAGAARETIVFGLDVGSTGHVAFEGREERAFDVSFAIPADPGGATRP